MRQKKLRRNLAIIAGIVFFVVIVPFFVLVMIYEMSFGKRINAPESISHTPDEFEGLTRVRHTFLSDKGQELVGYVYRVEGVDCKGAVVMAHGFGSGGHRSYMAAADYLARNGYLTFAYDVTGNDESGGDKVRGLPQGVIDLNYAISYAEGLDEFKNLPLFIFGHSWGGYSVSNVILYHPEVKAVAALSGFNRSSDLVESYARKMFGDWMKLLMPFERLYERMKFGKYASNTAMDAFAATDMPVLVIQGSIDNVVPASYGYDIWKKAYGDSERFTFMWVEGRGHGDVLFRSAPRKSAAGGTTGTGNMLLDVLTNKPSSYQKGDPKGTSAIQEDVGTAVIQFFDEHLE